MIPKITVSYGIACVRKYNNKYEILMVRKRCTYAYTEFVRGIYDPSRKHDLSYLFDNMTIEEKNIIRSENFDLIWYHSCGKVPISGDKYRYNKYEKKFNSLRKIRNGAYLNELIINSANVDLLWEIPKGRMHKGESSLNSAIREFSEETNLSKDKYRILFHDNTVDYTFIDNGVRYKYVYYLAIINSKTIPKFDYTSSYMTCEISNLKFLSSEYIRMLNNNRLYKISKIIIKKCKKYIT